MITKHKQLNILVRGIGKKKHEQYHRQNNRTILEWWKNVLFAKTSEKTLHLIGVHCALCSTNVPIK